MKKILLLLDPSYYTIKHFLFLFFIAGAFHVLNPQGLLNFVLIKQSIDFHKNEIKNNKEKLSLVKSKINKLENSVDYQSFVIRDRLGLLKSNEISFEFISPKIMKRKR